MTSDKTETQRTSYHPGMKPEIARSTAFLVSSKSMLVTTIQRVTDLSRMVSTNARARRAARSATCSRHFATPMD